jgi:hypothetical protein
MVTVQLTCAETPYEKANKPINSKKKIFIFCVKYFIKNDGLFLRRRKGKNNIEVYVTVC